MSTNSRTTGISIGADPESIREIGYVINDILKSENTDPVKIAALETIQHATAVENASISNNMIRFEGRSLWALLTGRGY